MIHDRKGALQRRFLLGRQFVVVPREPHETPDEPLRYPDHYCLECGAMRIRCWQCEGTVRWPIVQVRDGYHIGNCDEHGLMVMVCPCKPALSADDYAAIASQPIEPRQLTHRAPEPQAPPSPDALEHERKREHVAVAVGVLVGFVLGVVLTLITVGVLVASR